MTDWFLHPRLADCRRVFISDFNLPAAIGVSAEEIGRTQPIRVNAEIWLACQHTPSDADRLEDVLDYNFIRPGVQEIVQSGHIGLLEKLGDDILEMVLGQPKVVAARICVEKTEMFKDCASVGVEVFRFNPS